MMTYWYEIILQNLSQDVSSYQRVIDGLTERGQSLVQSSTDPRVAGHIKQLNARYQQLHDTAKVGHCTTHNLVVQCCL